MLAAPDDGAAVATPPVALLVADQPSVNHVANVYEWLANTAERSLDITDAYLVAPNRVLAAFENAARRGVEVRLLLPGRNNHPVAAAAARRGYESLLDAGVRIYEWKGVMVHAKTIVADGRATLVGSSNLDPLSLRRNYELNLLIDDVTTGAAMRSMFVRDLAEAAQIDLIRWRQRSAWQKWGERIAGAFASNL
jgi:cardiolipin synthase